MRFRKLRFVACGLAATALVACGPVSSCGAPAPVAAPSPPPVYVPPPPPAPPTTPNPVICLPYLCDVASPPPAPPPTVAPDPWVNSYWGGGYTQFQIAQSSLDEWARDVASAPDSWVYLYHGSLDNGTLVKTLGLNATVAAYLSTDQRVAVDTVCNPRHLPGRPTYSYDRWIVRSKIPLQVYLTYFLPNQVSYGGWSGELAPTTQIPNTNSLQNDFFDYGIDNWGVNLLPQPLMGNQADVPPGCGLGYYSLPYARQYGT